MCFHFACPMASVPHASGSHMHLKSTKRHFSCTLTCFEFCMHPAFLGHMFQITLRVTCVSIPHAVLFHMLCYSMPSIPPVFYTRFNSTHHLVPQALCLHVHFTAVPVRNALSIQNAPLRRLKTMCGTHVVIPPAFHHVSIPLPHR